MLYLLSHPSLAATFFGVDEQSIAALTQQTRPAEFDQPGNAGEEGAVLLGPLPGAQTGPELQIEAEEAARRQKGRKSNRIDNKPAMPAANAKRKLEEQSERQVNSLVGPRAERRRKASLDC